MKFNLTIKAKDRVFDYKYVVFKDEVKAEPLPSCDEKGQLLSRILLNKATQERVVKSQVAWVYGDGAAYTGEIYKMFNGKPTLGFKGRIKEVGVADLLELPLNEAYDLIACKTYTGYCPELYDYLFSKAKTIKFGAWFGNGFQGYVCYLYPSQMYDGWVEMIAGNIYKSEQMKNIVDDFIAEEKLKAKLKTKADTVNRVQIAELIPSLRRKN